MRTVAIITVAVLTSAAFFLYTNSQRQEPCYNWKLDDAVLFGKAQIRRSQIHDDINDYVQVECK